MCGISIPSSLFLVSAIVAIGLYPTIALGSARIISDRFAKLAYDWPVVGLAKIVIYGTPLLLSLLNAVVTLAICIKEKVPS